VDKPYRAADFDYEYPPEAVAQHPLPDRSASRLLMLDHASGAIRHRNFRDFPHLLTAGDVLVLNTSRVIPARLRGTRENGREAELLLVHAEPDDQWLAMVHPGGKLKVGRRIRFGDDAIAEIVDVLRGGLRRIRFTGPADVSKLMQHFGAVPLPPYITRAAEPSDSERYQTIFADVDGSVAAPTAGLHFTQDLLRQLSDRGVQIANTLLHVGPGTFKPVDVDDPSQHTMHAEWYAISDATADTINTARAHGHRIWAVGTTVTRTLETAAAGANEVTAGSGWTDLFIYPPFEFRIVDALLTNFHLPRSTLLMLVAAFAGYGHTMAAYHAAIVEGYRLFSYGDAMVVT
jgi:S-adenosylmethionine:tRNA ribosyltransferase-isomerase